MSVGLAYVGSMIALTIVLAVVYTIAHDAFAPVRDLVRQSARRAAKLLGLLAVLAAIVHLMTTL